MEIPRNHNFLLILTIGYSFVILYIGLRPFSFNMLNSVNWLNNKSGIRIGKIEPHENFVSKGIVYSKDKLMVKKKSDMMLTIELWLKSDKQLANGIQSILTIDDINSCERFLVEQYKSLLIISYGNKKIENKKKRKIGVDNVINKNEALFLTISLGPKGLKLYLNGILLESYPAYILNKQFNQVLGRLVLGISPSGQNPWVGEIYGIGIYSDTLSAQQVYKNIDFWKSKKLAELINLKKPIALYTFNEANGKYIYNIVDDFNHLLIPTNVHILNKEILKISERNSSISTSYFLDIFINIFGFVPYSFLICHYFQMRHQFLLKRHYFTIIIFCSLLSLFIEVTQTYMPQRDSSLFDLFLNITGGILGTSIFHFKHLQLLVTEV